ncbi:DsbE family thiol:disulfide interchange protein [Nitrogeniibacter mangrovi]|uniref:DsbE family thiol:disulfide interchange protein n=1 Tax=Nitrogeniibacter mangrovi TaxID=2016596 RepID=A0A6C1B6K8_9RHOO|nr:DsbE family thiol:disulfide interchange protein [Nitrogeniibacter mangrovi]QID17920.1 DsbE family thiol:disulfide interchange protein [Nitrogeniibacter mangrovi]
MQPATENTLDRSVDDRPHAPDSSPRRPLRAFLPLVMFLLIAVVLGVGLFLDPREVPSPLIGKPVPEFSLAPVQGRTLGLSTADLKGDVALVNVFASWCVACREEHPLLVDLARRGIVTIHGLNYKDKPEDAAAWLDSLGDPYTRTGADRDGRVAIDWGVYGVPETFVVGPDGRIAYKRIGPMTEAFIEETLIPMVRRLRAQGGGASPPQPASGVAGAARGD